MTPTTFLKETMTHPTKEGVEIAKRIIEENNRLIEEAKESWEDIWRSRIGHYIDRLGVGGYGIAEEVNWCIEELRTLRLSAYTEGFDAGVRTVNKAGKITIEINASTRNDGFEEGRKKEREEIRKIAEKKRDSYGEYSCEWYAYNNLITHLNNKN